MMGSEIASGIDYCIIEDCLEEKGNEEETQHSLLMIRTKSLFQIKYYHFSKKRNTTPSLPIILWIPTQYKSVYVQYSSATKQPYIETHKWLSW